MVNRASTRWELRRSTGSRVRGFDSRAAAREYKRNANAHLRIWDNINQEYVR